MRSIPNYPIVDFWENPQKFWLSQFCLIKALLSLSLSRLSCAGWKKFLRYCHEWFVVPPCMSYELHPGYEFEIFRNVCEPKYFYLITSFVYEPSLFLRCFQNKAPGHHWDTFCPSILLQILFRRMKALFLCKKNSSSNFLNFRILFFFVFLQNLNLDKKTFKNYFI